MPRTNRLQPGVILTISTHNYLNIPFIVTNSTGMILDMFNISRTGSNYNIRQRVINMVNMIQSLYNLDTIILEQSKLFLDKIDKYPDPFVLRNVILDFGIGVSIEDAFWNKYTILAFPEYEWKSEAFGKYKAKYAIDLFKSHVLHRGDIPKKQLIIIDDNNYYEAICLSESVLSDKLMNKKYQVNREREGE